MILGAYVLRGTGERLYGVQYDNDERQLDLNLPPHVTACVTLFHSRESTVLGQPYTLDQNDYVWVYSFFDSFVIVLRTTSDEDLSSLARRMVALSRELASSFGSVLKIWSGNMGEIEGMDNLVDKYVKLDLDSSEEMVPIIDSILNTAFTNHDLAYAGVIDASGMMVAGNIPENHLSLIQGELVREAVKPSTDIVPMAIEVIGYDVQILRVHSLTVVAAPHKDGSKVSAKTAASEIAQTLSESFA
ncbi:MAG: hypothetical protein ACXAEF_02700 [Candidatus Thorarchaeota archaeon]